MATSNVDWRFPKMGPRSIWRYRSTFHQPDPHLGQWRHFPKQRWWIRTVEGHDNHQGAGSIQRTSLLLQTYFEIYHLQNVSSLLPLWRPGVFVPSGILDAQRGSGWYPGAGVRFGSVRIRHSSRVASGWKENIPVQHDSTCEYGHVAEKHEFPLSGVLVSLSTQAGVLWEESYCADSSYLRIEVSRFQLLPSWIVSILSLLKQFVQS